MEYIIKFKHARALEKALKNATPEERDEYEKEKELNKEYNTDWSHIAGPDDSSTPLYYRSKVIDDIFKKEKKEKR